jgi:hypothetical protein
MTLGNLEKIGRWHHLFDKLCNDASFRDAASLAARYCEIAGSDGQRDHDAALRNINNWRSGRHIPRSRSLRILEKMLDLDENPELLERWAVLYQQASRNDGDASSDPISGMAAGKPMRSRGSISPLWATAGGVMIFVFGVAVGSVASSDWRPWGGPADDAPLVVYKPEVWMSVGQSKVIHAERGNCGKLPRDWPDVVADLPPTALGSFSDGGLARRNSKYCKGMTPARAIIFTAKRAGIEEFNIQGDFLKVTIAESNQEGS